MRTLALFASLFAFAAMAQPPKPAAPKKKDEFKISDFEQAVIDLTNAERKKEKLEPLKAAPLLFAAARKHSANMAKQDKLEHTLDDKTVKDRVVAEGYKYTRIAENVAWNQKTPAQVVDSWMKSEGHRKNILTPELTEIGVGVEKNAKGENYWTQVFGTPRGK